MWLFPLIFNLRAGWYRMITVWALFTLITFFIIWKATKSPMTPYTPRYVGLHFKLYCF